MRADGGTRPNLGCAARPRAQRHLAVSGRASLPAPRFPAFSSLLPTEHILRPGYDFGDEFEIGLTVLLDALTRSIPGDGSQPLP